MSQSPTIPEVVAEFKADLVDAYTFNALAAFVTYEYIITFGQEVTMVWRRRWSLVTWMFVANRYLMIGLMIYTISPFTAKVRPTIFVYKSIAYLAHRGTLINQIMGMAQFSVFAAFSALRAFAIWDRNVYIAALVLLLNLVPVGTGIYTTARGTAAFIVDPILGTFCMGYPDISASLNFA
ncbi:hypothetical protein EW026_g7749 [Hermanssonia centrifuga]|uniref:DUF6533 domain-containing protein n=1 Tax=Hermanssonia centrifuga TaxID=98765 RepID=A0A4S4K6R7_9APHY|nr:hypothetical protein EW026_g7749 [Hermanssonia centrifuga]